MLGPSPTLGVVVAVQNAEANLTQIVERLKPELHRDVVFIFCHTDADPRTANLVRGPENVRVLRGAGGSAIPHLWRDGIMALDTDNVAVTTAHCIPFAGWIERLMAADLSMAAGIGGVIENDQASDGIAWAMYMLRYLPYAPPQSARNVADIAADNAIYRRAEIMRNPDLLAEGFWEPSFHALFAQRGLPLRMDPALRVCHCNRYSAGRFAAMRFEHGQAFGRARVREASAAMRLLRIASGPVLPLVFLLKILRRVGTNHRCLTKLPVALPWLVFFILAWNSGEFIGYLRGGKTETLQSKGTTET